MRFEKKMRLKCPTCKHKAVIYTHPGSPDDVSNVYARCRNADCEKNGHSFVTQIAFMHWVDPKVSSVQMTLESLFDNLPMDAQKDFIASRSAASV